MDNNLNKFNLGAIQYYSDVDTDCIQKNMIKENIICL